MQLSSVTRASHACAFAWMRGPCQRPLNAALVFRSTAPSTLGSSREARRFETSCMRRGTREASADRGRQHDQRRIQFVRSNGRCAYVCRRPRVFHADDALYSPAPASAFQYQCGKRVKRRRIQRSQVLRWRPSELFPVKALAALRLRMKRRSASRFVDRIRNAVRSVRGGAAKRRDRDRADWSTTVVVRIASTSSVRLLIRGEQYSGCMPTPAASCSGWC
jgi:hypothetical protein